MKRFARSTGGKAVLFAGCILSLAILIISLLTGLYMIDAGVYTQSKDSIYIQMIRHELGNKGLYFLTEVSNAAEKPVIETGGSMAFDLLDETGKTVLKTAGADEITSWPYAAYFLAETNEETDSEEYQIFEFWYADLYTQKPIPVPYHAPGSKNAVFTLKAAEEAGSAKPDVFSFRKQLTDVLYSLKISIWIIVAAALGVTLFFFISLMCVSGRRNGTEEVVPGFLHRVPFDLMLAVCGILVIAPLAFWFDSGRISEIWDGVLLAGLLLLAAMAVLGLCMSVSARLKTRTLIRNTVIWRAAVLLTKGSAALWRLIKKGLHAAGAFLKDLPLIPKTIAAVLIISLAEFLVIVLAVNTHSDEMILLFWFIEKLILIPVVLYAVIILKKLKKSGEFLAAGDLSHQTDLKGMTGDFKRHGEDLNRIAEGMNLAVEEKMKSERMKTELITNVSHDIKTPLTSVINYVDLISREETDNVKIKEYSEVLKRQSDRLKRLIEDLVEASKASSGSLDIDPEALNVSVLLQQAAGEYEEKLKKAGLELVLTIPEEDAIILADSRRMWRIFDNLLNNTAKYAQPGTRVYLSLEREEDQAVISLKNISRDPLNISEEELMERFTRGDASRHTEGSGLGLSIAKSLAELQGGELHIKIDGDLFKAELSFPQIK